MPAAGGCLPVAGSAAGRLSTTGRWPVVAIMQLAVAGSGVGGRPVRGCPRPWTLVVTIMRPLATGEGLAALAASRLLVGPGRRLAVTVRRPIVVIGWMGRCRWRSALWIFSSSLKPKVMWRVS